MKKLIVDKKYDKKKLNTFLLDTFPNLKQSTLFKALRQKDIKINDKRVSDNVIVNFNDNIKVFISDEFLLGNVTKKLDIIYEDDNILIVNKPQEIEVTGNNNSLEETLKKTINLQFLKPCHRLDRNTSGLTLFAKNQESLDILLDKFKEREIDKYYKALVYGIPEKNKARLEAYLFKDTKKSIVYISDIPKKGYQKIITNYSIINKNKENNTASLDIKLETGRTHQIRAHLAHIGHPIIGDR